MPLWFQIIGVLSGFAALLFGVYRAGYKRGRGAALKDQARTADQTKLNKIYAPLRRVSMDAYLVTWTFVHYPSVKSRFKRARPFLGRGEVAKFIKVFLDRGVSRPDTEVEYGKYSRDSIEKIIKDNIEVCDPQLLQLLAEAVRAKHEYIKYQDPESEVGDVFGVEDTKLLEHIFNEHERLVKRLGLS